MASFRSVTKKENGFIWECNDSYLTGKSLNVLHRLSSKKRTAVIFPIHLLSNCQVHYEPLFLFCTRDLLNLLFSLNNVNFKVIVHSAPRKGVMAQGQEFIVVEDSKSSRREEENQASCPPLHCVRAGSLPTFTSVCLPLTQAKAVYKGRTLGRCWLELERL